MISCQKLSSALCLASWSTLGFKVMRLPLKTSLGLKNQVQIWKKSLMCGQQFELYANANDRLFDDFGIRFHRGQFSVTGGSS